MNSRWQEAWDEAEQKLRAWEQSWVSQYVKERPLRVGQLDAELLDEEVVQLLLEPVLKALGTLNVRLFLTRTTLGPILNYILVNLQEQS